jgi:phage tail-like protein
MSETYYPPGAFYFSVRVLGAGALVSAMTGSDAAFQEVSGMQAEWGIEEVVEGGENRFVHRLPKPARYSNLVLKRGVVTTSSFLAEWVGQSIGSSLTLPLVPQNLMVTLLNDAGSPIIVWAFANAFPLKWDVGPLNSMDNKILVETLEFSYNYFERVNLGSALGAAAKLAQLAARFA